MNKKYYTVRMSYVRYDDGHYLLYLGEQRVDDYHPDTQQGDTESGGDAITAYSYEGPEPDGSTKIEAESASYREFVAGLVRTRYSQSDVEAILCNHGDGDADHEAEYQAFQQWREQAKQTARELLDRDIS